MVLLRFLDRLIDASVLAGGRHLRRLTKKGSSRGQQALHMWVVYQSRRRKDPLVKATVIIAMYCCFCAMRSISLLCGLLDDGTSLDGGYFQDLKKLDEYNLKGR